MLFKEVVGQEDIKRRLLAEVHGNRIPHALMFCGTTGGGTLPLALAFARYLLCASPTDTDACGTCPSCRMTQGYAHPDLHFSFPVIRYKDAEHSVSDVYLEKWRKRLNENPYFDLADWLADMEAGNQQALIYAAESDAIQRRLSLKSSQGGRKVLILCWPEKMRVECANKLLKLIEEPPAQTVFLLVSEEPDKVLPTILSRTQTIRVPALEQTVLEQVLTERHHLAPADAASTARIACGSYTAALKALTMNSENALFFDLFVMLMRLSYLRKIKEMRKWSEQVAALGRERQKDFLAYCQRLIRENFIYNFHREELNYQTREENDFSKNFARFVNERNVIPIMEELSAAERDVEQNVNPKMVFFDFALKMIVLLIQ